MPRCSHLITALFANTLIVGCGDASSSDGSGTARFTTWGEEYIEEGIPSAEDGEDGFVDGWSVTYTKFLVNIHEISVADDQGDVAAVASKSYFVDLTKAGRKELVSFADLDAQAWESVGYQIKPAVAKAKVVSGKATDLSMMVDEGYSIYVAGRASKGSTEKTFSWGFDTATQYADCRHETGGKEALGIVVKNNSVDTSELTIHGDHFFYDRLQSSPDPTIETALRFEERAAADEPPNGDGDGDITLDELASAPIDVSKYDPSGLRAPDLGAFAKALSRSIGHFNGEGECSISGL